MTKITILVLIGMFASAVAEASDSHVWENSVWQVAGRHAGVKPEIVYSIAVRESGMRWKDGKTRPWPWTVNSPRGAMRFGSKERAYQTCAAVLHP